MDRSNDSNLPNYSTQFLTVPIQRDMSTHGQVKQNEKEERETHMAPRHTPYQINDAKELLSDIYISLVALKSGIDAVSNTNTDQHAIDRINALIDEVGTHVIKNIPDELDNLLI